MDGPTQLLRSALREYMRSSVYLGRGVVDEIRIENITSHHVFFLVLETLFEHRRYRYRYHNWSGENLPESKLTQGDLWDIPVPAPKSFRNKEIDVPLPHLDWLIDECGACEGRGALTVLRPACLAITFEAHKLTRTLGRGSVPKKELARVTIPPILHLQGTPLELPATGDGYRQAHLLGDPRMKKAIQSMLNKTMLASNVRIAAQQLTVHRIPVVVAAYHWSTVRAHVWLIGTSGCHHVYAPSPPFRMGRSERLAAETRTFISRIMGFGSILIGKKVHCKGCGMVLPIDPKHVSEEEYCSEGCKANYKRLSTLPPLPRG